MTGTAKHDPCLVKKAVAAYETGKADRHVATRGVAPLVATSIASRYQLVRGLFGNEFLFTKDTENAFIQRKEVFFPYADLLQIDRILTACITRRADSESA